MKNDEFGSQQHLEKSKESGSCMPEARAGRFCKGGGPGRGVPLLSNTRIECKKRGQKSLKIIENETSNDTTMIENEAMEGSGGL